jgi:hypothetical protein
VTVLVNDPPVANDDIVVAVLDAQNTASEFDILGNDTDTEGGIDPSTVTIVSGPDSNLGEIEEIKADGTIVYRPNSNVTTPEVDSFTYTVSDLNGAISNTATVTINIVDDPYPWHNLLNPPDVNGDTFVSPIDFLIVITHLNNEGQGTLPLPVSGGFEPPPYLDTNSDNRVSPTDALLIINYLNTNLPGGGGGGGEIDDYLEVVGADANPPITSIDVLANDIAGASGPLTLVPSGLNTTGTTGSVQVNVATNRILYTPAAGFYNLDSFSYTATDTNDTTHTANVTLQVSKADGSCSPDQELASCDDGINYIVETLQISPTGALTGLPITSPLDVGQEFEVRISVQDARGGILPADAGLYAAFMDVLYDADFVDVKPSATPITFGDNYQNFKQGVVGVPGVVNELGAAQGNFTPLGNGVEVLASMIFITKAEGTATIQLDPADMSPAHDTVVHEPANNQVIDHAIISYGSSIVTVIPVNDLPTLASLSDLTVDEDATEQTINLAGITAGGGENQPLRVTATSGNTDLIANPAVAYTSAETTGSLKFTPVSDASGSAVITVTVEDGGLDEDLNTAGDNLIHSETFTVTISPVNDLPALASLSNLTINEDTPARTVSLFGITAGGGESQPLRVTASSSNTDLIPSPTVVYTSAESTGSLTFTPLPDANGSTVITVTVEDGGLDADLATSSDNASNLETFTVTVTAVDDPPTATAGSYQPDENELLTVTTENGLIQFASDPDGDALTFSLVAGTAHGQLVLATNGSFTYHPDTNFNRTDSFQYVANDGSANSNEATVTLSINTEHPWYNTFVPTDVNDDGHVHPIDALYLIDSFNRDGSTVLSKSRSEGLVAPFYDVNHDGILDSADAIVVIDDINRLSTGNGEGEAAFDWHEFDRSLTSLPVSRLSLSDWTTSRSTSSAPVAVVERDLERPRVSDSQITWQRRIDDAIVDLTGEEEELLFGDLDDLIDSIDGLLAEE